MAYKLDGILMQTDMGPESMAQVTEVWADIASGKIPLLTDTAGTPVKDHVPVTEYIDYDGVLEGKPYTMAIRSVTPDFFQELQQKTQDGLFRLYETTSDSGRIDECSADAWQKAQADEQAGNLQIDYSYAVESTVPAQVAGDGKAHCMLYVKRKSLTHR